MRNLTLDDYRADLRMYERDLRRALLTRHRDGGWFETRTARRDRARSLVRMVRQLRATCGVPRSRGGQMELFG